MRMQGVYATQAAVAQGENHYLAHLQTFREFSEALVNKKTDFSLVPQLT